VTVQAELLQKRAKKLRQRLDLSLTSTWRSFEALVACLVASNALEADTLKALPLGHIARQIHGENELWLAIVLTHPAVQVNTPCYCLVTVLCCAVLYCAALRCAVHDVSSFVLSLHCTEANAWFPIMSGFVVVLLVWFKYTPRQASRGQHVCAAEPDTTSAGWCAWCNHDRREHL